MNLEALLDTYHIIKDVVNHVHAQAFRLKSLPNECQAFTLGEIGDVVLYYQFHVDRQKQLITGFDVYVANDERDHFIDRHDFKDPIKVMFT